MYIMGLAGGFDRVFETHFSFPIDFAHDAAAVLLRDGKVVAAVEEERLNRIKHTNKAPENAIRFCLETAGIELEEVDFFAYYATEEFLDSFFARMFLEQPRLGEFKGIREMLLDVLERCCGFRPGADRLQFVSHHMSHAVSSFAMCGHDEALVLSIDGVGESVSTMVLDGRDKELNVLSSKPQHFSLGNYYTRVIGFLGYRIYDEYKVMGLAPYGDPSRFREVFDGFYALLPDGEYVIYNERIMSLYEILTPRRRGTPFSQLHKDLAASLQESLEKIVFHILDHFRDLTGHEFLAVTGGVGQNSSMIGKLWESGMFKDIFVQPAADDAGCAVGCALAVAHHLNPSLPKTRLQHTFWGPGLGSDESIQSMLEGWTDFVEFRRVDDICKETAQLIAGGAVIGWVQGRLEYGPRALGNRSIIADPRPSENKDIINAMIKKREAYRPFAPSVLEEAAAEFFELPESQNCFPFMSCVLKVREGWRAKLGAITHADGSSRLQTVSRESNPRYHSLIEAFGAITGIPMLLNTSFNNNVEPIVNMPEEAVTCFLTSGLNYLVVGDFLVSKREINTGGLVHFTLALSPCSQLTATHAHFSDVGRETVYELVRNYEVTRRTRISPEAYRVIGIADASLDLAQVLAECELPASAELMDELFELWGMRYINIRPVGNHE